MHDPIPERLSQRLRELHTIQLDLHRLLVQAEREAYEVDHGPMSPVEMLQHLLNNPRFAWLRTISGVLAEIDGLLSPRRPGTGSAGMELLLRMRTIYISPDPESDFHRKYREALQRDSEILVLHGRVRKLLEAPLG